MNTPAAWWRKCKRRKPGIYLVRTRKHRGRRRENGYVGESVNVDLRELCHYGKCRHVSCLPKPWIDLDPVWHVLWLPWWLGWKWVLKPLETVGICCTWPRYNDKKNRWNPRRVSLWQQRDQRLRRDRAASMHLWLDRAPAFRPVQLAGVAVILLGVVMTVWSNIR